MRLTRRSVGLLWRRKKRRRSRVCAPLRTRRRPLVVRVTAPDHGHERPCSARCPPPVRRHSSGPGVQRSPRGSPSITPHAVVKASRGAAVYPRHCRTFSRQWRRRGSARGCVVPSYTPNRKNNALPAHRQLLEWTRVLPGGPTCGPPDRAGGAACGPTSGSTSSDMRLGGQQGIGFSHAAMGGRWLTTKRVCALPPWDTLTRFPWDEAEKVSPDGRPFAPGPARDGRTTRLAAAAPALAAQR